MIFHWRHYRGAVIMNEGYVKAPCRVTAKRTVTYHMKLENVVPRAYRSKWSEKADFTITGIDDLRGVKFPMSSGREFVVFFDPERERAMVNALRNPKQDTILLF